MKNQLTDQHWFNKSFFISTLTGMFLLLVSLVINFYASTYATKEASNAVSDILLDNLPIFDVSFFFVEGAVFFIFLIILLIISKPIRAPYILKSMATFILIRAFSVTLTHIAPFPNRVTIETTNNLLKKFFFDGDLFFSGHAGIPFLFALIFWKHKPLRYLFLAGSAAGGIGVILGHLHYSIDVFAAYFITYTIFHLTKKFFYQDYQLFLESIDNNRQQK